MASRDQVIKLVEATTTILGERNIDRHYSFSVSGNGGWRFLIFPIMGVAYREGALNNRENLSELLCENYPLINILRRKFLNAPERAAIFLWCSLMYNQGNAGAYFYKYLLHISDEDIGRIKYIHEQREIIKQHLKKIGAELEIGPIPESPLTIREKQRMEEIAHQRATGSTKLRDHEPWTGFPDPRGNRWDSWDNDGYW